MLVSWEIVDTTALMKVYQKPTYEIVARFLLKLPFIGCLLHGQCFMYIIFMPQRYTPSISFLSLVYIWEFWGPKWYRTCFIRVTQLANGQLEYETPSSWVQSWSAFSSTLGVPPTTLIQALSGQISNELMQDTGTKLVNYFTLTYTWQSSGLKMWACKHWTEMQKDKNANHRMWIQSVIALTRKSKFNPIIRNPEGLPNSFCDLGVVFISAARNYIGSSETKPNQCPSFPLSSCHFPRCD